MPLGNPIRKQNESRVVSVLATEGQTVFTVQGGYIINQISVFRNGVRLSNSEDFTAGDGSTVTLNNEANIDDRIEFHVFDRFTVQNAIVSAASTQTISGDVVVNGKIFGNLDVANVNTGIVTATEGVIIPDNKVLSIGDRVVGSSKGDLKLYHDGSNSYIDEVGSGNLLIRNGSDTAIFCQTDGVVKLYNDGNEKLSTTNGGVSVSGDLTISRHLSVTGISTFQAVQGTTGTFSGNLVINDSVPKLFFTDTNNNPDYDLRNQDGAFVINDATSSVNRFIVQADGHIDIPGNVDFAAGIDVIGDVTITDKIVHAGDTNTAIRFPAADTITAETDGSERLRIDASGRLLVGSTSSRTIANHAARIQLQGTDYQTSTLSIINNANAGNGAFLFFASQRSGSVGGSTIVQNNDSIGTLRFFAGDGTDINSYAAEIQVNIDGTPGSDDVPGRITFKTTADGAAGPTERLRINSSGQISIRGTNTAFDTTGDLDSLQMYYETDSGQASIGPYSSGGNTYLSFYTNSGGSAATEKLRISSSGKVRVGSGSAVYELEVQGSGAQHILVGSTNANGAALVLDGDSNGDGSGTDYSIIQHNTSGNLVLTADNPSNNAVMMFVTGDGNEKMRIDNSGRLLLAATSGTARFHIKGNGGDGIKIENSGGTNAACIDLKNTLSSYVQEYRLAVAGSDGAYGTAKALFVRDQTSGANRFEIQAGGDVRVSTGNLIIGTSGKGVDFSATGGPASGSGTSELLDDYEEGTCNPQWVPASGTFGIIYQTGHYTKIGDIVHLTGSISINGATNASGEVQITGLPFSVRGVNSTWSGEGGHGVGRWFYAGPNHFCFLVCDNSSDRIRVHKADGTFLNYTNMSTGYNQSQFSFTVTYFAD